MGRGKWILIAVLASSAVLAPEPARAGFIRVREAVVVGADRLARGVETAPAVDGTLASSDVPAHAPAHAPVSQTLHERYGSLGQAEGACGAGASSSTTVSGAPLAALPVSPTVLSPLALITRLPSEMGPAFATPPPWTLLKPPRD